MRGAVQLKDDEPIMAGLLERGFAQAQADVIVALTLVMCERYPNGEQMPKEELDVLIRELCEAHGLT